MWPALVRHVLLPLHEALLRRPTLPAVRELADTTSSTEERIQAYQAERLRTLIQHAGLTSSYWRRTAPADTAAIGLNEIPVLTRTDVRLSREEMRSESFPGKVIEHVSSGTTDDNLVFYLDRERQAWDRAERLHSLAMLGVSPGEKQLHFWPTFGSGGRFGGIKDFTRTVRDYLMGDRAFDLRTMSDERLETGLALYESYRPAVIVGYPSVLFALAQTRMRKGAFPAAHAPRLVLSTGELLYDFQRQAIEAAFHAPVVEEYGSQEAGLIAHEDKSGGWRLNWQHVVVEVLRDRRLVRPGELGEVVITNLHSRAMPFIRYATGDVVLMQHDQASSGLGLTSLPPIEGRASDLPVDTSGRPQSNRDLVEMLVRETGATEFSLHQEEPERILCMTLRRSGLLGQEAKVTALLRSVLGKTLQVEWRAGNAFRPLKSGKRRYISSPVSYRLLAHDREPGMFLSRAWPQQLVDAD